MDSLERRFEPHGQVPWDELINPLRNELLFHVEEAWLALYFRFILPDEERLPLLYKLVDRVASPSGGYSDAPQCATAPPIPTLPIRTPAGLALALRSVYSALVAAWQLQYLSLLDAVSIYTLL